MSESHLTYPALAVEPIASTSTSTNAGASSSTSQAPRATAKDRLYVGNLHPSVNEYTLLQIFAKFGKVSNLDFLFHKAGPLKGKPRGYAFVEYASKDEADRALSSAHGKLLHGRKLVVTHAHQAPLDAGSSSSSSGGAQRRKIPSESSRPTALSILKTGNAGPSSGKNKHDGTGSKIAMMEAKLKQMEAESTGPANTPSVAHPSLPPKPPASEQTIRTVPASTTPLAPERQSEPRPSIPRLLGSSYSSAGSSTLPNRSKATPRSNSGLTGVKIVKPKAKEKKNGSPTPDSKSTSTQ